MIINKIQESCIHSYTFFDPNKSFGQLLTIAPKNFMFVKKSSVELSYPEVWFCD